MINWQQFGLKKDPYDTFPLIEGGDIPIEKAFVGRETEKKFLNDLFSSENHVCLTLCGEVGVGKTSLANFHKYLWKYERKQKPLFSFRREIEACEELLNKKSFLIEIIGSVLREIKLLAPDLLKNDLLRKINQIVDLSQTLSISAGASALGFGANLGVGKSLFQPLSFSMTSLEEYLTSLLEFLIKTEIAGRRYSGLIIHVNNFDVVTAESGTKKQAFKFFNEIRDILQIPNLYFLFLGPPNFFKDIISSQSRVKSIFFQTPLRINPLSKGEIVRAFEERMSLLQSDDVIKYLKPVEDEVVYSLYDLHNGDIRSIMSSLRDLLSRSAEKLSKTLTLDEAKLLLGQERMARIEKIIKLTPDQKRLLLHLAVSDKFISQKEIAQIFSKAASNVSGYYFRPLKEAGIIEEKERSGKIVYWGLTENFLPLKWLVESQKQIQEKVKQTTLF